MGYTKISTKNKRAGNRPFVRIGSGGVIYINTFAMRQYLQGKTRVVLLYDKDKNFLAIKPVGKNETDSFSLIFSDKKSQSTGVVAARSAIHSLNIDYSKKVYYEPKWNKSEGALEISLDNPIKKK